MRECNGQITQSEMERLTRLVDSARTFLRHRDLQHLERLEEKLDQAEVITEKLAAADVIAMNSQVRIKDMDAGKEAVYTLVFPRDADVSKGRISVLAPIGVALLGSGWERSSKGACRQGFEGSRCRRSCSPSTHHRATSPRMWRDYARGSSGCRGLSSYGWRLMSDRYHKAAIWLDMGSRFAKGGSQQCNGIWHIGTP